MQWLGVVFTLISVYLVNQRQEIAKGLTAFKKQSSDQAVLAEIGEKISTKLETPVE